MPSTLATGVSSPVSSSASSVPPTSAVNTISSLTSVNTSPASSTPARVTSSLLKLSRQPSSALQISMSVTSVVTTAVPSSTSLSVPSSTVPLTSARVTTSGNDNQSTLSAETPIQPSSPLTTTVPTTIQSTLTLSSLSATVPSMFTSSTPTSAPTSNSDIPSATTFLPLPSGASPQSSPGRTETLLTTALEGTTIFITSTNSQGLVVTSALPVVTEVITTTENGGIVTTVTRAIVNPTLAPNNSTTENSSFFTNTGAVIGVFVVVGLASASIMIWILFAVRHRQRMKRIEQDITVEAAVAAAGLSRVPLDEDDEDDSPVSPNAHHLFTSRMVRRSSLLGLGGSGSLGTSAKVSEAPDGVIIKDSASSHPEWPVEHRTNNYPGGCTTTRTTSPSPRVEQFISDVGSSRDRKSSYGHTPTYSAGSFEPLLANYAQNMSDQDTPALTIQPSRNRSPQHLESDSSDGSPEVGSSVSSKRQNTSDNSIIPDDEDHTHYVLTVRNVLDDQSQHSL